MQKEARQVSAFINDLVDLQPIKTWSFLATIFGDMHRNGRATLSGTELRQILEPIGIRPEAIRVALHRLRKDGWIETEKLGRETQYSLSSHAVEETQAASADIYRRDIKFSDGWCLATYNISDPQIRSGIPVSKQAWLVPAATVSELGSALVSQIEKTAIPEWVLKDIISEEQRHNGQRLVSIVQEAKALSGHLSAEEILMLRMLILHHWRRMALRVETWFHIWIEADGIFAICHGEVLSALDMLQQAPETV